MQLQFSSYSVFSFTSRIRCVSYCSQLFENLISFHITYFAMIMEGFQTYRRNPLFFPQLVHQILKYCDFTTVRKCRLVCILWEEEANKVIKIKKCPIVISSSTLKPKTGLCDLVASGSNNVIIDKNLDASVGNNIITQIHNAQEEIKLKIQFLEIQNSPWTTSQFEEILQNLPHLQELTLSENFILPKISSHSHPHQKQNSLAINFPNLHSLHLNLTDEHLQNFANVEFLSQLLKCAPNLREITCDQKQFSKPGCSQTTIFSKLLFRTVLDVFGVPGNELNLPPPLNYLDINVDLREEDFDLLQNAGLLLKSLHLPINSMISSQRVDSLLNSLKETLRKLKMTYRSSTVKFPSLENITNLKKLAIHGTGSEVMGLDNRTRYRRRSNFGIGFGPSSNTLIGSESQPETTPSNSAGLYKYTDIDLDLDETIYYIFNVTPSSLFPCGVDGPPKSLKHLTELQLKSVYYIPKDVFHLRTLFPNLRQLEMSFLDDSLLQAVIKGFPQLECLGASEGFFCDTGITGISPEVQDLFKNFKVSQVYDTKRLREFPSLLSLLNLKVLELGSPRVTSFGVINGVRLCSSVQEFVLNLPQMDDNSLLSFMEQPTWDSITVKAGSFSPTVLQLMKSQSYNGRRKFHYHPDRN